MFSVYINDLSESKLSHLYTFSDAGEAYKIAETLHNIIGYAFDVVIFEIKSKVVDGDYNETMIERYYFTST